MSDRRRLPPPSARRKLLSGWAHDLRNLIQAQGLAVSHLQEGATAPERSLLEQMSTGMEQIAFEAAHFIEAAYACAGAPEPPVKVAVDELLRRATRRHDDRVTVEPSHLVVDANAYALARTAREMSLLLSRSQFAQQLRVSSSAARGRLTIEVVAGDGPVRPNAALLRERLDTTFSTLQGLTGVVVTVNRDGRGLKAVFRARLHGNARPLVLVLSRDSAVLREVGRACRGAAVEVQSWPTSMPLLFALQEIKSPADVAACVIDAGLTDDCTERLYQALGREPLRERVFIVREDGESQVPGPLQHVGGVLARAELATSLKASLLRRTANQEQELG